MKSKEFKSLIIVLLVISTLSFSVFLVFDKIFPSKNQFQEEFIISNSKISDLRVANEDLTNGIPICTAMDNQYGPKICSDGAGGAIITWLDNRSGIEYDIYAQKVVSSGNVYWTVNGEAVCTENNDQGTPYICSDGGGGAIITWLDARSGLYDYDIYTQRMDSNGLPKWTPNGVPLCTASGSQQFPQICSDGVGGAIITWTDQRILFDDIYAQRINPIGTIMWTPNGTAICTAGNNQGYPQICSDGAEGAIITWEDERAGTYKMDIYTQSINSTGIVQWTSNGIPICIVNNNQRYPQIWPDGTGGAIITWEDWRSGMDVFAQSFNSTGNVRWTPNGMAICTTTIDQWHPQICSDGVGGAIITWQDMGGGFNIYAQRINSIGNVQWIPNGTAISIASGTQTRPHICSDGAGGAIITWDDSRSGSSLDIYAQRIDSSGNVKWTSNGIAVCTAINNQFSTQICSDEAGGAIITWFDKRNGTFFDIYAERIDSNGNRLWSIIEENDIIPFGNYYILFITVSIICLIIVIKQQFSTNPNLKSKIK